MLAGSTVQFLKNLEKNNNKPWFDAHRSDYDEARNDFLQMVGKLIPLIANFDPSIAELEAKNCVFRINRDVRFAKDKRPYKNNMAAYFNREGKKGLGAGYYLHVEPTKSFVAVGIWMPEPKVLSAIRQEIDYNYKEWQKILSTAAFKKVFPNGPSAEGKLTRPPKGYGEDNPAIDYIKLKSFVLSAPLKDEDLSDKNFETAVAKIMQTGYPFLGFLNRAVE